MGFAVLLAVPAESSLQFVQNVEVIRPVFGTLPSNGYFKNGISGAHWAVVSRSAFSPIDPTSPTY